MNRKIFPESYTYLSKCILIMFEWLPLFKMHNRGFSDQASLVPILFVFKADRLCVCFFIFPVWGRTHAPLLTFNVQQQLATPCWTTSYLTVPCR